MSTVNEVTFEEVLKSKLGSSYQRAYKVFQDYGENLSFDVTNVLMHAADQDRVEEVLSRLEAHYQEHLAYQHPEIRGLASGSFGNPTQVLFEEICTEVLCLESTSA